MLGITGIFSIHAKQVPYSLHLFSDTLSLLLEWEEIRAEKTRKHIWEASINLGH